MTSYCAARLLQPQLRFLVVRPSEHDLIPEALWKAQPDDRVDLEEAESMVLRAVERLRDDRLGLEFGRNLRFGEGGVFDYAVHSAATLRDSLLVAARFSAIITDSLRIWQETFKGRAVLRLEDDVWAAPSADFAICAFFKLHLAEVLPEGSQLEVWFPYQAPADMSPYLANFPGATFNFGAPFFGYAFDRGALDARLPGADPVLHAIHCHRAKSLLGELGERQTTRAQVRRLILKSLCDTQEAPSRRVASALRMSQRTMRRRLDREGTSFAEELEGVRRELALVQVGETETPLADIAFLLGFSHPESFHRAFKRWTGETPLRYRTRARARG